MTNRAASSRDGDAPRGPLEPITAHMPNGSGGGEKKFAHFRALAAYLGARTANVDAEEMLGDPPHASSRDARWSPSSWSWRGS